jgi:hypothetical protein
MSEFGCDVVLTFGWLSGLDSNQDKGLQRALCYRYTTGQTGLTLAFDQLRRKEKDFAATRDEGDWQE